MDYDNQLRPGADSRGKTSFRRGAALIALAALLAGFAAGAALFRFLPPSGGNMAGEKKQAGLAQYEKDLAEARQGMEQAKARAQKAAEESEALRAENRGLQDKLDAAGARGELAPGFDQCMNRAGSDLEMKDCAEAAFEYQDRRLNRIYPKVLNSCSRAERPDACRAEVKKMELAWISYRDAMSRFIYQGAAFGEYGGTLDRLNGVIFLAEETMAQADRLSRLGE